MQLTDDQKSQIAQRLKDGAGIADIQRLINDEFKFHMTYMEVRFLLDDLDLDLAAPSKTEDAENDDAEAEAAPADDGQEAVPADAELVGGGVSVEIDKVKRPGAALSGSVTFSDGVKAQWFVDPYGRLGLDADQEGYQPSQDDIEEFQLELQKQMQGPGAI